MKDFEGHVKEFAVWVLIWRQWGYVCDQKERLASFLCNGPHSRYFRLSQQSGVAGEKPYHTETNECDCVPIKFYLCTLTFKFHIIPKAIFFILFN